MRRKGLRLLLVEDDEPLLRVARLTLEGFGWSVVSFTDPRRAVQFVRGGARFDLLVADAVMPGLGGSELLDKLTLYCPDLAAVYISGHPEHLVPGCVAGQRSVFLSKPYTARELYRKVQEARRLPGVRNGRIK